MMICILSQNNTWYYFPLSHQLVWAELLPEPKLRDIHGETVGYIQSRKYHLTVY